MADLATFSDDFPGTALDLTKWQAGVGSTPVVAASRVSFAEVGAAYKRIRTLPDAAWTLGLNAFVQWRADTDPGKHWLVMLDSGTGDNPGETVLIVGLSAVDPTQLSFVAQKGAVTASETIAYDQTAHKFFRIAVHTAAGATRYYLYSSPDAATWTHRLTSTFTVTPAAVIRLTFQGSDGAYLAKVNGSATLAPTPAVPADPANPMGVDPFNPYATQPAQTDPSCATLLDLIREFSAAVRRAVRLIGTNTIEMVPWDEPLPTGFAIADAAGMYHTHSQELKAGDRALSLLAGDLSMEGGASLITNDVRLATSDWRLPQRLPVYGLSVAPVKRVSFTFTPKTFSGSVELVFPAVPLEVRRT
jgi:hypothetical protein